MQSGLSAQQIINQLLLAGWTLQSLQEYAPELFLQPAVPMTPATPPDQTFVQPSPETVFTPEQPAAQIYSSEILPAANVAPQLEPQVTKGKSRAVIVALIVAVLMITGIAAYFLIFNNSGGSLKNFNDPNFSMSIPKGWTGDASYEPGSTVVLYYSPEDSEKDSREKAALFTAYIGLKFDRIDQQLKYLEESKAEYRIINDETFETNGVSYRLVEYSAKGSGQVDAIHTLMVNATKGDFVINADVVSKEADWQLHAEEAGEMLRSIKPACDNVSEKNEVSSGVVLLCS